MEIPIISNYGNFFSKQFMKKIVWNPESTLLQGESAGKLLFIYKTTYIQHIKVLKIYSLIYLVNNDTYFMYIAGIKSLWEKRDPL